MPKDLPDNLELEVKKLVSDITGRSVEELKPDANFWQDLGIDSIKAIEITVAIEKRFKIRIRDEQIPEITNVGQALEVLKQALKEKENES